MSRDEKTAQVVAAIDLTPMGRRVADRARQIAESLQAKLLLLHSVEPLGEAFFTEELAELLKTYRAESAAKVADWCREKTDAPVELSTVKGSPAWEILRAGKRADVIVVGTSAVDAARLGPVSRRVAATSRRDVLVVRRQPRGPYRRSVVGVDFSEASALAVELSLRLAPDAETTLVHVLPSRFDSYMADAGMYVEEIDFTRQSRMEAAKAALNDFAGRWGDRVRAIVEHGPPAEVLEEVIRRRSADLAVVANRGAGATRLVLLGTVAGGVLSAAPCDVAVARIPGEFRRP